MRQYRVTYFQDCGYGAIGSVVLTDAESLKEAIETFPQQVRSNGFACTAQPDDVTVMEVEIYGSKGWSKIYDWTEDREPAVSVVDDGEGFSFRFLPGLWERWTKAK